MAVSNPTTSARSLYKLSALDIKAAAIGDVLYDGGGLEYHCTATGAGKWLYRYQSPVTRRRREMGVSANTLAAARATADDSRKRVKAGGDPLIDREREAQAEREREAERTRQEVRNAATLGARCIDYHHSISSKFRSSKSRKQWLASLERYMPPAMWNRPIGSITVAELLPLFDALAERVPESAKRTRARLAAVWDDAILLGFADSNPAQAIARRLREKRQQRRVVVEHLRALPYQRIPDFVDALRASERVGMSVKLCLLFTLATAARSGEARGATWGEVDLERRLWIVPPHKMKVPEEHRVALSDFGMSTLAEAEQLRAGDSPDDLIFPAPRNARRELSDMSLLMALRRLGTGRRRDDGNEPETYRDLMCVHGLRSSFSSWSAEVAEARVDVSEACLAHREADRVRAAYQRSKFDTERAELLERWGRFCVAPKVVDLRQARSEG